MLETKTEDGTVVKDVKAIKKKKVKPTEIEKEKTLPARKKTPVKRSLMIPEDLPLQKVKVKADVPPVNTLNKFTACGKVVEVGQKPTEEQLSEMYIKLFDYPPIQNSPKPKRCKINKKDAPE